MSVYKDNATGKWRVIYRYTDITGKRKQTQKRGFETKREAVAWEHEMMLKSQAKLGVAGEQPSHMYNKTIIADAVGSDNLQNGCKSISLNKFID